MAFEAYLENLRSKPEHIRRRFAFWWSFGITAVIAVFWLASFNDLGLKMGAGSAVANAVSRAGTPAQSLVAGVGVFAGDVWSMITGPKKVTYSEVIVTPGSR